MGNVVACYKWVLDEESIRVRDDLSIDVSRAQRKISDYDRNAIEAAAALAGQAGGKAIGLTLGDKTSKKSVKDALSRGLDEAVRVDAGERAPQDAGVTAAVLAKAVQGMDGVSVVVCGDGSSDLFNRQTAVRVAYALGWPVVTGASAVEVDGGVLRATRTLDDEVEHVEVALPAVVAVLPEAAEVHIPTLKQIMAAGKKPQREVPVSDLAVAPEARTEVESESGFANDRKQVVFDSADEGCIDELVSALKREGVL